ncbi:MAG: YidB family protein [Polaromonas sp.]
MGLLDSVLGSVMGGQQQAGAAGGGGLGSLISMVTSNPQLMQAVTGMLSNDGGQGGLGGLMAKFQQAGLGDVVGSWVGSGQNQPVSGDQLTNVLGADTMASLAEKLGMSQGDAAGQLSNILPGLIDKLTPNGAAPAGGLGNAGDLMGMLGGLLQKR